MTESAPGARGGPMDVEFMSLALIGGKDERRVNRGWQDDGKRAYSFSYSAATVVYSTHSALGG